MPTKEMIKEHPNLSKVRNRIIEEKRKIGIIKKKSAFVEFGGKKEEKK
jgi:hypothetical protein